MIYKKMNNFRDNLNTILLKLIIKCLNIAPKILDLPHNRKLMCLASSSDTNPLRTSWIYSISLLTFYHNFDTQLNLWYLDFGKFNICLLSKGRLYWGRNSLAGGVFLCLEVEEKRETTTNPLVFTFSHNMDGMELFDVLWQDNRQCEQW